MLAISMILHGYVRVALTREIVTLPSSSGWRSTSSALRLNSGNSSRKSIPLWANDSSPGRGIVPPPESPTDEIVWCGLRNGRCEMSGLSFGSIPAIEWIFVTSSASSKVKSGSIPLMRWASIVFPVPGLPMSSTLWLPAAAISKARFIFSCPFTSQKSSRDSCFCENMALTSILRGNICFSPEKCINNSFRFFTG